MKTPTSKHLRETENRHLTPGLQNFAILADRAMKKGRGSKLWDVEGREYIDLIGGIGVNALGHCHPKYVARLKQQLDELTIGSFTTEVRVELLELLAKVLPKHLSRVQLYSGGSEAVEAALRLAKSHTKKWEFLSFWGAFHGKTMGTMALMGSTAKQGLGPFPPGNISAPFANCYRCPFKLKYPSCGMLCAEFTRDTIKQQSSGALAAIIVEPMQGTAGNIPPPKEWLSAIASIAKEFGALLICDEMITGFGRTGTMFASPEVGVEADIMTLGKGVASGFPLSMLACRAEIADAKPFAIPSGSSSSYGGNPLAAAAALASIQTIVDEKLVENSRAQGEIFLARLQKWKSQFDFIGDVRGKGLFLAMELVKDHTTKTPIAKEKTESLFKAGVEKGVLAMTYAASVRFQPALSINAEELNRGLDLLEETLREWQI
ncbi:MAG TPA: aspartate aminotransferase family protein [Oligoflexia bacterium]|nr:aspartate aminotransferase family protein [Oligoflexia bacterium]